MAIPSAEIINAYRYHGMLNAEEPTEKRPPCRPLLLKLKDELTLPPYGPESPHRHDCPNSKVRTNMWLSPPRFFWEQPEVGFLNQLGRVCVDARLRDCHNKRCVDMRKIMDKSAPRCGWKSFRNWAIVAMSCQKTFGHEQKLSRAHTHLVNAVHECMATLDQCKSRRNLFSVFLCGPSRLQIAVDLFEVCNIIHWMATIQARIGLGPDTYERWDHHFLPASVTLFAIDEASRELQALRLCKNRIWNLVNLAERKQSDLPDIVNALEGRPSLRHEGHDFCSPSKCQFAHEDSTKVEQLHKCGTLKNCEQRQFPLNLLETAVELKQKTAWSRSGPYLSTPTEQYLAISHVWSDGTGASTKTPGSVNRCLFDYFARLAENLKCNAIWWDAISIPFEPKARSKAIAQMHRNYSNAEYTVVHDQYLLNMNWTDSGTACLALVLSPWFTRGWTALELSMSRNVKVLFKGPDRSTPDIKDLDADILAPEPGTTFRAHWVASSLIRRLRRTSVDNIVDILAILRPRSTSWMRDRTVIAGLLANVPKCDYARSESEVTRDIILHLGAVPHTSLLHGQATMFESGGFSWCPATLDDMPIDLSTKMDGDADSDNMLHVDSRGVVSGRWEHRMIHPDDLRKERLQPHGQDLAAVSKVHIALQSWKNCLLLREGPNQSLMLLVAAVGVEERGEFMTVDCRYVGAVRLTAGAAETGLDFSGRVPIRIGNENGRPDIPALDVHIRTRQAGFDHVARLEALMISRGHGVDLPDYGEMCNRMYAEYEAELRQQEDSRWYSSSGVTEYRRPSASETAKVWKECGPEPTETKSAHLLLALKRYDRESVRHLVRRGFRIPAGMESDLETLLGRNSLAGMEMLGTVYLESGMLREAEAIIQRTVDISLRTHGREGQSTIINMAILGRVYMKQGRLDEAATMFLHVVKTCYEKPNLRTSFWSSAIADIVLLYTDQDRLNEADEIYKLALEEYGTPPDQQQICSYDKDIRWALPFADRIKRDKAAEAFYKRALSGFEITCGKGKEDAYGGEYALTLITAYNLATGYISQKKVDEADEIAGRYLQRFEKELGQEHMLTLHMTYDLGRIRMYQGKETEGVQLWGTALRGFKGKFGPGHRLIRLVALSLGQYYLSHGNLGPAEEMCRLAQKGANDKQDSKHTITLRATRELGRIHCKSGRLTNVEATYQSVLKRLRTALGPDHIEVYHTVFYLGELYEDLDRFREAEEKFQCALAGYEILCGPEDEWTLRGVSRLGRLYEKQGELNKAVDWTRRALRGFEESNDPNHSQQLMDFTTLGRLYMRQNKFDDAQAMLQRAREGFEMAFGPEHELSVRVTHNLGQVFQAQGKLDQSKEMLEKALQGFVKVFGPEDALTLMVISDLAEVYTRCGKWDGAEGMYRRVIQGFSQAYGPSHRLTLRTTTRLGDLYTDQGKLDKAGELIQNALKRSQATLGQGDTATLDAVVSLGKLYRLQGKQREAEEKMKEALEGFQTALGPNNISTHDAAATLGYLYLEQFRFDKAESLIRRAMEGYENTLGQDHPSTLRAIQALGDIYFGRSKPEQGAKMHQRAWKGFEKICGPDHALALRTLLCPGPLSTGFRPGWLERTDYQSSRP